MNRLALTTDNTDITDQKARNPSTEAIGVADHGIDQALRCIRAHPGNPWLKSVASDE